MEGFKPQTFAIDKYIVARFILAIGLFFFIYDVPFNFLPYNTGVFIAMIAWGWLFIDLIRGKQLYINISGTLILSVIVVATCYSYLYTFIQGTHDTHVPRLLWLFVVLYFPGANLLSEAFLRLKYTLDDILYLLVKLFVVQSLIIYVMFLVPNIKQTVFNVMRDGDIRNVLNLGSAGFRALGLSYGTTWDLSVLQSLGLLFIVVLLKKKNIFLLGVYYLIILGSMIISGRTGLLGGFLSIILLVCQLFSGSKAIFKRTGKFFRSIVLTMILLVTIVYNSLSAETKFILTESLIPWAFELFISKGESGSFETSSSNELKGMYFSVPTSTLIFGDGYFEDPIDNTQYYKGTDAGYMRHVLYYGLIGSMILYTFHLLLFGYLAYHFRKRFGILYGILILLIGIYFFIAHIKGDILMGGNMPLKVIFVLFFYLLGLKSKNSYTNV